MRFCPSNGRCGRFGPAFRGKFTSKNHGLWGTFQSRYTKVTNIGAMKRRHLREMEVRWLLWYCLGSGVSEPQTYSYLDLE